MLQLELFEELLLPLAAGRSCSLFLCHDRS